MSQNAEHDTTTTPEPATEVNETAEALQADLLHSGIEEIEIPGPSAPVKSIPLVRTLSEKIRAYSLGNPWFFIALAALLLAGWQWWETRSRLNLIQTDVANRLGTSIQTMAEAQNQVRENTAKIAAISTNLRALESSANDAQSQRQAMQMLYQEIAQTRDDNTLLEIERALIAADQHLKLSGNVQAALNALQAADTRLTSVNQPDWTALRQDINFDINQLKSLPFADTKHINSRLEMILVSIDELPLKSDTKTPGSNSASQANDGDQENSFWWRWGGRFIAEFWQELKGLIRIEHFSPNEAPFLAPGQDWFLRENLKLRLLDARLALFAQDYDSYRNDLLTAHNWMNRFYDESNQKVSTAKTQLLELAEARVKYEIPSLSRSFTALKKAETANTNSPIDTAISRRRREIQ